MIVECRGARREEASTETLDHRGPSPTGLGRSVERETQCSVVPGEGSTGVVCGVNWRKTKGDRIMSRRFPSEVVISRSSSWPMGVYEDSARSRPISSHVCRIAVGHCSQRPYEGNLPYGRPVGIGHAQGLPHRSTVHSPSTETKQTTEHSPVYRPPSSPSSVFPPGNATCASRVFGPLPLICPLSCPSGRSLRRKRISGRAPGAVTQSSWKNSESVGAGTFAGEPLSAGCEGAGKTWFGGGETRRMIATAARRGSASEVHELFWKRALGRKGGTYE